MTYVDHELTASMARNIRFFLRPQNQNVRHQTVLVSDDATANQEVFRG
jgi:hypothetical protein